MLRKSIAAALLVAMVAWAEMALAPMFVMYAWQVRPARAMSEHMAAHHHAMPAGHRCCLGLRKNEGPVSLELAAGSLPCDDQHRCCFRQGPLSVPVPVNSGRLLSQEIGPAETVAVGPQPDAGSPVSPVAGLDPGPPPGLLAMVLRV